MYNSKDAILEAVKAFSDETRIPLDQICVGGGAALMLMGLRKSTNDLNLWVDNPHFDKLAEEKAVVNHPMHDTVIPYGLEWVRERNRYFGHVMIDGIQVFNTLSLLVNKRGGYQDVRRPLAKRQQDLQDIIKLDTIRAERNKVQEVVAAG